MSKVWEDFVNIMQPAQPYGIDFPLGGVQYPQGNYPSIDQNYMESFGKLGNINPQENPLGIAMANVGNASVLANMEDAYRAGRMQDVMNNPNISPPAPVMAPIPAAAPQPPAFNVDPVAQYFDMYRAARAQEAQQRSLDPFGVGGDYQDLR